MGKFSMSMRCYVANGLGQQILDRGAALQASPNGDPRDCTSIRVAVQLLNSQPQANGPGQAKSHLNRCSRSLIQAVGGDSNLVFRRSRRHAPTSAPARTPSCWKLSFARGHPCLEKTRVNAIKLFPLQFLSTNQLRHLNNIRINHWNQSNRYFGSGFNYIQLHSTPIMFCQFGLQSCHSHFGSGVHFYRV